MPGAHQECCLRADARCKHKAASWYGTQTHARQGSHLKPGCTVGAARKVLRALPTISGKGRYSATRAQVSARILAKPRLFHCISLARLHSRALCEYRAPTESAPNELLQKGLGKAGGALANGSGTTYHLRLPHCNMFCQVVGLPVTIRPRMDNMTWPSGIPFLSCFVLPSLRALQHLV